MLAQGGPGQQRAARGAPAGSPLLPVAFPAIGFSAVATSVSKRDRTRRAELQRMLGERGTVLPRVEHGTPERPAQGWYAELVDGKTVFLGDYSMLAVIAIANLDGASA